MSMGVATSVADKIFVRDLRLRTHIGVADWEQKARQDIVVNLVMHHDQRAAAASDDLQHTIDYKAVRDDLVAFIEAGTWKLLEALSEDIAEHVLSHDGVQAVDVTIDKPGALRFADSVAVQIHRERR